jgi:hypothetical protein
MSKVKTPTVMREARLRKWPAGRLAQLKLFLGHLEQAVGVSLAAQVEQSPKRTFSEFVPKIVPQDISVELSFKELRITFEAPRGLTNLLFYEYQLSATEGFFNFDQFQSPETHYIWPGLTEGTTYFLRVRVVTKHGEVGPWSDVEEVETPFAQSYGLFDATERSQKISTTNGNPWTTLWERTYTAIGGKAYYSLDYDVSSFRDWGSNLQGNIEWTDVEFKWMELEPGDEEYTQKGRSFQVTSYSSSNQWSLSGFYSFKVVTDGYSTNLDIPGTWTNPRRGTFVQKFSTLELGDYTFRLQARIQSADHSGFKNDFVAVQGTSFTYGADANVKVKNFNIYETLVSN